MHKHSFQLAIKNLRVMAIIGCCDVEAIEAQAIDVTVKIHFSRSPLAAQTDNIDDALCYKSLTEAITQFCQSRHFHLIENLSDGLSDRLYELTIEHHGNISKIELEIYKYSIQSTLGGICWAQTIDIDAKGS